MTSKTKKHAAKPRHATTKTSRTAIAACPNIKSPKPTANREAVATQPSRGTKAALLREMLAAPGGTSLEALMRATTWQGHSVRAALTAIRKSGTNVARLREGGVTTYSIASPSSRASAS